MNQGNKHGSGWSTVHLKMRRYQTRRLQDTLVIADTGLGVASSEAEGVTGDGSKNVCAVEQGLGKLGSGDDRDGSCVVDSSNQLGLSVACDDSKFLVPLNFHSSRYGMFLWGCIIL